MSLSRHAYCSRCQLCDEVVLVSVFGFAVAVCDVLSAASAREENATYDSRDPAEDAARDPEGKGAKGHSSACCRGDDGGDKMMCERVVIAKIGGDCKSAAETIESGSESAAAKIESESDIDGGVDVKSALK
jgi:hypothetical protein